MSRREEVRYLSTVVVNSFAFPSLADAGLWGAIGSLLLDFWAPLVLCIGLTLFAAFAGGFIGLISKGGDKVKSM